MKKRLLLLAACITGLSSVYGQSQMLNSAAPDQKLLPSADGGSNAAIGNLFSPSLFDGSANVSIPIYQYSNDNGNFGISLSYNTKGVTVDELSGPLGTHWGLNCGGSISRTCRDIPDETDMNTPAYPASLHLVGRQAMYALTTQGSNEYWDGQNDDYNVSVGNLNFTFKLGKNGYIYTYPDSRARIVKTTPNPNTPLEYGFKITDVDGTIYEFDVCEHIDLNFQTGIATTNNNINATADILYISKWKLIKVTLPDGQFIKYNYHESTYPDNMYLYRSMSIKENNTPDTTAPPSYYVTAANGGGGFSFFLDSINYPNNVTAIFDIDQTPLPTTNGYLNSIKQIRISKGGTCTRYIFNKSYLKHYNGYTTASVIPFNNELDYNDDTYGRMVLNSITTGNCTGTETEPYYSFEYSTEAPSPRTSGYRDFFGYPNLLDQTGSGGYFFNFYPLHTVKFSSPAYTAGMSKDVTSDINVLSTLVLTKVNNAYGGSVTFQYEPHSGITNVMPLPTSITSDPLFVGLNANDGIRLKSVTTQDKFHPSNYSVTNYFYSGGQFFLNGGYYSFPSLSDASGNITEYTMTNNWISPHQLINGSNHGYSNVTVEKRDNASNLLSRTTYNYTNFSDNSALRYYLSGNSHTRNYYEAPYTDKQYIHDWEIGLPQVVTEYDLTGSIIKRTTNHFSSVLKDPSALSAGLLLNVNTLRNTISTTQNTNILLGRIIASDTFLPFSGMSQLDTSIVETFMDDVTEVRDTTIYGYDNRGNQIGTLTRNSKRDYFTTNNIYNYAVIEAGALTSNPFSTALNQMYADGIEKVVGTERWKQDLGSGFNAFSNLLYDASISIFTYSGGKVFNPKTYTLASLAPISYTSYTGRMQSVPSTTFQNPYGSILSAYNASPVTNFQVASEVLQTDANNNPTETQVLGKDMYKAMLWDPATNQKLAEAACRLNEMAYSSFETTNTGNWTYNTADVVDATATVGRLDGPYCLQAGSNETAPLTVSGLTPGKEYTLTFWSKGGLPTISGGGLSSIPLTVVSSTTAPTGGWSFYMARFTPITSGTVGFTQTGISGTTFTYYIDDARICPTGVDMTSTNYTPMSGPSSTVDPTGRITFYEYDNFGRQVVTRSQEGYILSKKEFHISQ